MKIFAASITLFLIAAISDVTASSAFRTRKAKAKMIRRQPKDLSSYDGFEEADHTPIILRPRPKGAQETIQPVQLPKPERKVGSPVTTQTAHKQSLTQSTIEESERTRMADELEVTKNALLIIQKHKDTTSTAEFASNVSFQKLKARNECLTRQISALRKNVKQLESLNEIHEHLLQNLGLSKNTSVKSIVEMDIQVKKRVSRLIVRLFYVLERSVEANKSMQAYIESRRN